MSRHGARLRGHSRTASRGEGWLPILCHQIKSTGDVTLTSGGTRSAAILLALNQVLVPVGIKVSPGAAGRLLPLSLREGGRQA